MVKIKPKSVVGLNMSVKRPFLPTRNIAVLCLATLLSVNSTELLATSYPLPESPNDSLVGNPESSFTRVTAKEEDTLLDIARNYNLGQDEIVRINPKVDRWLPGQGTPVKLPNNRLLPNAPRQGLVLNLPEFRLYYYPRVKKDQPGIVLTHPISIGRSDWETPLGRTTIIAKTKDPVWIPPQSIKDEHEAKGEPLPDIVPAGEDNPLGAYALRLGIPGYLIHGTNKPFGVGMRVSHGCIRMYPEDIERLFPEVKRGTSVTIVNQPIKVGWLKNTLYIEVHPDLEVPKEDSEQYYIHRLELALTKIQEANDGYLPVLNGALLRQALEQQSGVPVAIFTRPKIFANHENVTKDKKAGHPSLYK